MNGFDFAVWAFSGDSLSSLDWSITTAALGGTLIAFGTASPTGSLIEPNALGYNILDEAVSGLNLALSGGVTYWLELQNAVVPSANFIYWDRSDGPSTAYNNILGKLPGSESFRIDSNTSVPEPSTAFLLGGAMIGLIAFHRKKLSGRTRPFA